MSVEFVDTNILVYAHDRDAGVKHQKAAALLARLIDGGAIVLSVQVLMEFFVTATRKIPKPIRTEAAEEIIADLSELAVFAPDARDVVGGIRVARRNQISFWDGMIVHAAAQMSAETLWSEDLAHGQIYEGVKVLNPFA